MNLSGLAHTVGTVGAPPTVAVPDVLTIGNVSTTDNNPGGHTEQISGFSLAMDESGASTEFVVRSGRLTTQQHGTVDLATGAGEPLVVDGNGDLVAGTILATPSVRETAGGCRK